MKFIHGASSRRSLVLLGFFVFIELCIVLLSALAISLSTAAVQRNAHDGAARSGEASVVTVRQHFQSVFATLEPYAGGPVATILQPGADTPGNRQAASEQLRGL